MDAFIRVNEFTSAYMQCTYVRHDSSVRVACECVYLCHFNTNTVGCVHPREWCYKCIYICSAHMPSTFTCINKSTVHVNECTIHANKWPIHANECTIWMNVQFTWMNAQFTRINAQFMWMNDQFTRMNVQFTRINVQFTQINAQFKWMNAHFTWMHILRTKASRNPASVEPVWTCPLETSEYRHTATHCNNCNTLQHQLLSNPAHSVVVQIGKYVSLEWMVQIKQQGSFQHKLCSRPYTKKASAQMNESCHI